MASHDLRFCIERYPNYENGKLVSVSWGCPCLNMMGYSTLSEMFFDIGKINIKKQLTKLKG